MTHRADALGGHRRAVAVAKALALLGSAAIVVVTGMGWVGYHAASTGITTSEALADEPPPAGSDQNILIMGLDGRRDQRGRPLPPDIYDALHAGGEDSGEGDADALIVLHLPAGNAPATAISIPRDDYVDLAGCPTSSCRGKIKEAYRFAYQKVIDDGSDGAESPAAKEQKAREAGRKAEISTVRKLLEIPIDHFIEVTLVGFFQVARVVQPITVCLNEDTSDRYYSGADFHRGTQQINADQAMAFVRQRRDTDNELFTDLDRTRRQQAFIVSLVNALRRNGTLSNPARLRSLLDVAKQNVAVDAGLDFEGFLRDASAFPDRPVTLYTLPVTDFGAISNGEDVNFIDVSTIRSIVRKLVAPSSPTAAPQTANAAQPNAGTIALDVVNASGVEGEAAHLEKSLATKPFIAGMVSTADSISQSSTIIYGPGAKAAAGKLAGELGLSASASDNVAPNTVRLTVGTDIANLEYPNHTTESPTTTVTTVSATATGTQQPSPTDLTRMAADNIPCVR